ncbi:hypothetical protein NOF04DRAFT_1092858 [Fusarium oxysporum II5]|nr:hypothetical protein NOF04DRAFT_1092858 [Fusarium oxysporum II5]
MAVLIIHQSISAASISASFSCSDGAFALAARTLGLLDTAQSHHGCPRQSSLRHVLSQNGSSGVSSCLCLLGGSGASLTRKTTISFPHSYHAHSPSRQLHHQTPADILTIEMPLDGYSRTRQRFCLEITRHMNLDQLSNTVSFDPSAALALVDNQPAN